MPACINDVTTQNSDIEVEHEDDRAGVDQPLDDVSTQGEATETKSEDLCESDGG